MKINSKLFGLSLLLAISGCFQLVKGVPFADMQDRWWAVVITLGLSFVVVDKFTDKLFEFIVNISVHTFVFIVKLLPIQWATEKRKKGYSNYHKRGEQ